MDKLTGVKIKYENQSISNQIPIGVLAENVEWDKTHNLNNILGNIDISKGNLQSQINQLFDEKIDNSQIDNILSNYFGQEIATNVTDWLNNNVNPAGSAVMVDNSLIIAGAAADAKKTGEKITDLKTDIIQTAGAVEEMECGLTDEVKTALLACFTHVAWIGNDGQTYYNALSDALNRFRVISSIHAVFTQGSTTIYDTDELYALKQYLTVTVTYTDGVTKEVNNYALSGQLVAGTSTITVAYNKKTTTFNVTVTQQVKTLESISATFDSSASITTDNVLDELRPYLTVHGVYSDSSIDIITNYILSGSLNVGTNTITVTYNNKTATFTVNVAQAEKILQNITAVFNQGSAVIYTDSSLNDLKPYLTVTARYTDSTTQTVTNYTLSGNLAEGTSIITVSYGGKTTTFNVTVTEADLYSVLTLNDFSDTRGFTGFSVSNGAVTYTGVSQFSVASLDTGISSVIADTATTQYPLGPWIIFCKVNSTTYYIIDGSNPPKLFVFTYDSNTQKFTGTQDNTIANVQVGAGYTIAPSKTRADLVDNELLLYDVSGETDALIYKITNANCLGFWAHKNYERQVPFWSNVKVKYDMRIPTLSDIVEKRTCPELQLNSSGTLTCGTTKQFWLFAFDSGVTSIKYYHTNSASSKVAAWLVYKKVDDNTYYCTDGYERFRFEYDSSSNRFTATNISSTTEIEVLYGADKNSTYLSNGMYVTASLENNSVKVLSSYGYSFIIHDANCLGFWGMSAVTLSSFKVGGEI